MSDSSLPVNDIICKVECDECGKESVIHSSLEEACVKCKTIVCIYCKIVDGLCPGCSANPSNTKSA